jgi:hypothetical protein
VSGVCDQGGVWVGWCFIVRNTMQKIDV